jgi:hypothetical protein
VHYTTGPRMCLVSGGNCICRRMTLHVIHINYFMYSRLSFEGHVARIHLLQSHYQIRDPYGAGTASKTPIPPAVGVVLTGVSTPVDESAKNVLIVPVNIVVSPPLSEVWVGVVPAKT